MLKSRKGAIKLGLKRLQDTCKFLGPLYSIKVIDHAEAIYRKVNDAYELEVCDSSGPERYTVYLWQRIPHTELMCIYSDISSKEDLADTLGYLAFRCRNLSARIQVEREDLTR